MTDDSLNKPTIESLSKDVQFLRQQVVDTRVDVLQKTDETRAAINSLAAETRLYMQGLRIELQRLRRPLNGRLTIATVLSIVAVGLAVACFVQM